MMQTMRTKNTLSNIGFVKIILMLVVILGHACDFWIGTWFTENPVFQSQGLSVFAGWLNSFHIFAFALASGYIFAFKIEGGGTGGTLNSFKIRQRDCWFPIYFQC